MLDFIPKFCKALCLFIAINTLLSCNMASESTFSPDGSLSENTVIDFKELIQNKESFSSYFMKTDQDSISADMPADSLAQVVEMFTTSFISGFTNEILKLPLELTPFTKTKRFQKYIIETENTPIRSLEKLFIKRIETNGEVTGLEYQRRNITKDDQKALKDLMGSGNGINGSNFTNWDGKILTLQLNLQNNTNERYAQPNEMMEKFPITMQYKLNFKRKIKSIKAETLVPYLTKINDYQAVLSLTPKQIMEVMNGDYTDTFTIETE